MKESTYLAMDIFTQKRIIVSCLCLGSEMTYEYHAYTENQGY